MASQLDRLSAAVADRYTIQSEIGRGGMATVYLAEDLKHHRKVALKVLHPELAVTLGAERFVREIEIAAQLTHPHILMLIDSGEAHGPEGSGSFLYYVMPYIEGESLRDRLERSGPLAVDDAIRLTDQVASALSYAHERGVVHRDIKPENILIAGDQAIVADFGIARAVAVAGGERLTGTGLAIGTPAYMSPEQALGMSDVDGRSDVYALGCVLHEIISGRTPFEGSTPQALLAKHAADTVPSLRASDPAIPVFVERAVERALAKEPEDRFQSVGAFAEALTTGTVVRRVRQRRRWPNRASWGVAVAGVVAGTAAVLWSVRSAADVEVSLDPTLALVLPWRGGGGGEDVATVRENIPILLETLLTGADGLHLIEPFRAQAALDERTSAVGRELTNDEALELARDLGAGQLWWGNAVVLGDQLELSGNVWFTDGGSQMAPQSVGGTIDSVQALVYRMLVQVLSAQSGEQREWQELAVSPAVMVEYLNGRRLYNEANWGEAIEAFDAALSLDSTFAAAGFYRSIAQSMSRTSGMTASPGPESVACRMLDRLGERERSLLACEDESSGETLQRLEWATQIAPDWFEPWYFYGDFLFHHGFRDFGAASLPIQGWDAKYKDAVGRLTKLADAGAQESAARVAVYRGRTHLYVHLKDMLFNDSDTAALRDVVARLATLEPGSPVLVESQWKLAWLEGDTARGHELTGPLRESLTNGQGTASAMMNAWRSGAVPPQIIAEIVEDREWGTPFFRPFRSEFYFALNRGRPRAAQALVARLAESLHNFDRMWWSQWPMWASIVGDLDSASGARAMSALEAQGFEDLDRDPRRARAQLCHALHWRLQYGDFSMLDRVMELAVDSIGAPRLHPPGPMRGEACGAVVDALAAHRHHNPDADSLLSRADSILRATASPLAIHSIGPRVLVASLYWERGDLQRALALLPTKWGSIFLPHQALILKMEGDLAVQLGQVERAVEAYRYYLRFRYDPEPGAPTAERDRVLQALAELTGEPRAN